MNKKLKYGLIGASVGAILGIFSLGGMVGAGISLLTLPAYLVGIVFSLLNLKGEVYLSPIFIIGAIIWIIIGFLVGYYLLKKIIK